jgi:hypothetical protein
LKTVSVVGIWPISELFTASAVVLGNISVLLIMHLHNAIYNVKERDGFENR